MKMAEQWMIFLIYKRGENNYLLVVNASNIEKDLEWMNSMQRKMSKLKTHHLLMHCLLCKGHCQEVLQKLTNEPLNEIKFFRFKENVNISGQQVLVSRTGYTGEDGFEIYGITRSNCCIYGLQF